MRYLHRAATRCPRRSGRAARNRYCRRHRSWYWSTNELSQAAVPLLDPHRVYASAPGRRSRNRDRATVQARRRGRRRAGGRSSLFLVQVRAQHAGAALRSGSSAVAGRAESARSRIAPSTWSARRHGSDAWRCMRPARSCRRARRISVAIPCNTAHAFVEAIQSELDIPIMNSVLHADGG